MLQGDAITRDIVADLVRGAVDDAVKSQWARRAQEPAISTRIAGTLESRLNGYRVNGYNVTVVAQDFPDRGAGSWENKSGADLYIGIQVESLLPAPPVSKGLLIQAKRERTFARRHTDVAMTPSKVQNGLVEQCEKMLARTDKGAFVWTYGSSGVRVIPASDVVKHRIIPPDFLASRNVAEQFRDVLDCFSGDVMLVGQGIFDNDAALGAFLEEIAVRHGVAIKLASSEELRGER